MQTKGTAPKQIDPQELTRRARHYSFELLSSKKPIEQTLANLRREPWELQRQVFDAVSDEEQLRITMMGVMFPEELRELDLQHYGRFFRGKDLEEELSWAFAILRHNSERLGGALKAADSVNAAILRNEFGEADELLEQAKQVWGYSLWYLAAKLYIAERIEGVGAKRNIVQVVMKDSASAYVKAFAFLYSLRAEHRMSPSLFEEELRGQLNIESLELKSPAIAFHLRFRSFFTSIVDFPDEMLANNLAFDEGYALLDRYHTFVRTVQVILARSHDGQRPAWVTRIVRRAADIFPDPRLRACMRLLTAQEAEPNAELRGMVCAAIEAYTRGDYRKAADLSFEAIGRFSNAFEPYEIWVMSLGRLGETPSKPAFCVSMSNLDQRNAGSIPAEADLLGFFNQLDWIPLFGGVEAHWRSRAVTPQPLDPTKWQAVNAMVATPRAVLAFNDATLAHRYLESFSEKAEASTTIDLFKSVIDRHAPPTSIPPERQLKYRGLTAEREHDFRDAVDFYRAIGGQKLKDRASMQTALESEYRCLFNLGDLASCLELAVSELLKGEVVFFKAQLPLLLRQVDDAQEVNLDASLSWPIAHFWQRPGLTGRDGHAVFSALDAFLNAHEIRRPSQLGGKLAQFELAQLVFLLRHICVTDILDWSLEFKTAEELDNERVAILDLLEKIDPAHAKVFQEERTQITRRLVVQKGLREVDRGKIYVDTAGIRKSLGSSLVERVDRYLSLRDIEDYLDIVAEFRVDKKGLFIITQLRDGRIVADDGQRLFDSLHSEVKSRFLSSDEYGLDTSLSVEIRHGTLAGQIRGPFERAHLITRRETAEGQYAPNAFWLDRMNTEDPNLEAVDALLADFSGRVDETIELVKDKWIQLRDAEYNPEGLFAFEYSDSDLKQARAKADAGKDSDAFLEAVFTDLWGRTRTNLAAVQREIKTTLSAALQESLTELETNIQDFAPSIAADCRAHVASCRTELEAELEVIAGWFAIDEASAMSDFEIGVVVETALEQVRRAPGGEEFNPERTIKGDAVFQGRVFRSLAKVFYLVLENVVKHGGESASKSRIAIRAEKNELEIAVSNPIPASKDPHELAAAAGTLEANTRGEGEQSYLRQEGGSGYHKLGKLLRHDLGRCKYKVKVNVHDGRFEVVLRMELDGLLV